MWTESGPTGAGWGETNYLITEQIRKDNVMPVARRATVDGRGG